MKIVVIDDYQDAFRTLRCYAKLKGHEVVVYNNTEKDPARLAERLKEAEAVIMTQRRSPFPRAVIERLPKLRLISQTGRSTGHIDIEACTEHGVVLSAGEVTGGTGPTAELTWGLILAALRHIPYEVQRLREGHWQSTLGVACREKRSASMRMAASAAWWRMWGGRLVRASCAGVERGRWGARKRPDTRSRRAKMPSSPKATS